MTQQELDKFRAVVQKGFDGALKHNPKELDKILKDIGTTVEGFDAWLDNEVEQYKKEYVNG
jgi:hypothetical protein